MAQQLPVAQALPDGQQRLLEGWLPLAQMANLRYGWGLSAADLEALIVVAAPRLRGAQSALEAQAILWFTCQRLKASIL